MSPADRQPPDVASDAIRIRGARVHNLQNIDVDIPRNRLTVVTGPSGSGKSSLAFDTLYAEGQRQYIESLSVYARQFLDQLERPDVDLIEGLQPTLCIDQRPFAANPRSTVATVTEIYDYLRVLLARLGEPVCYQCKTPIRQQAPEEIEAALRELPEGTKIILMAPLVRGRRGRHDEVFAKVRKAGFVRVRVDGEVYDIDDAPELAPRKMHHIDAVVDRIIIRPDGSRRLAESIQLAVEHGEGLVIACYLEPNGAKGPWHDKLFSTKYACPNCDLSYEELEPRTFSFNSPYGACAQCDGLGCRTQFDLDLVLPDLKLSLAEGAVAAWKEGGAKLAQKRRGALKAFMAAHRFEWETPLSELSQSVFDKLLRGDGGRFEGLLVMLEKEWATATNTTRRQQLDTFRGQIVCDACQGSRLRPEAASVRVAGKAIQEITALSVGAAGRFFAEIAFPKKLQPIAKPLLDEIRRRLEFLEKVGVDYLTLDRRADSLSGGELQRVRLATGIGSGLVGVCYVLDEPSVGLHPRDNQRLIDALRDLERQGNTVLVVEHDEAMIRQADHLIDFGPGAGLHGGRIVAQGPPESIGGGNGSLTGRYLAGQLEIPIPTQRRRLAKSRSISIDGVSTNNLRDVSARFPLGGLICVTGVSGSGKSSLVNETFAPALKRRLGLSAAKPGPHTSLRGASGIDKVIEIDQSPIGRTPRSNAATYTGAFDEIRKVFAGTRDARQRGFRVGRFSFNAAAGRCPQCQGQGVIKIEMSFLPDLFVTCDECHGARYNRQTLEVRYRGQSIADVLSMPVERAVQFFENFAAIHRSLESLMAVGLEYLPLGQPSTTLSGGEAQRVKLATHLARAETGKTLYLLDEPTTGLHFDDIRKLLAVLQRLVDRGNTVVVVEHHLDVVKCADWVIDLGPEGGAQGGSIVVAGTPEEVAADDNSHTGRALREHL